MPTVENREQVKPPNDVNAAPPESKAERPIGFWLSIIALGVGAVLILWLIMYYLPDQSADSKVSLFSAQPGRSAYILASTIAVLTGVGACMLILCAFARVRFTSPHKIELALSMVAVALIVEAVLICAILGLDPARYEAILAAVAGYVLGRVRHSTNEPDTPPQPPTDPKQTPTGPAPASAPAPVPAPAPAPED